jgi:hypothetical protein
MTPDRIKHLRALADDATPGPWLNGTWRGHCNVPDHVVGHHGETSPCVYDFEMLPRPGYVVTSEPNTYIVSSDDYGQVLSDQNAAFIAAARTALPEALDALERVREACSTESYLEPDLGRTGAHVIMVADIIAALEGDTP